MNRKFFETENLINKGLKELRDEIKELRFQSQTEKKHNESLNINNEDATDYMDQPSLTNNSNKEEATDYIDQPSLQTVNVILQTVLKSDK